MVLKSAFASSATFKEILTGLKQTVKDRFVNNPSIVYIKSSEHEIEDQGIKFNVKILESLGSKPTATKDTFKAPSEGASTVEKKEFNPFLPPFEEG